jgi:hypothetical protein
VNGKLSWPIFWALLGVSIVIGGFFFIPIPALGAFRMSSLLFPSMVSAGAISLLLGVALIVLTVREKVRGMLRKFFLLAGASAVGLPVFAVLHNLVYGLFIYFFGENFWTRVGLEDEPFFFMMAIFVCPLGFLVGAIGSIVLRVKKCRTERKLASSL